jgi:hypothetical protein
MPIEMDPERMVERYRDLVQAFDAATHDAQRAEIRQAAKELRDRWREWQGEDSLHEMTFGEP